MSPNPLLPRIPLSYRLLLLYLEPLFAFNGAFLAIFWPALYLSTFSPLLAYHPDNQIVFNQLGATYILFAFNQAVVLRIATDLRVWKAMVLGILLCDTVHLWAGLVVMKAEGTMWIGKWRPEDWVAMSLLIGPMALRLGLLMGVGIKEEAGEKRQKKIE